MIILGIETSCDETAVAVVEDGKKILSNVVATSLAKHAQTGGIIPEVAAREQVKCIIPVIKEALKQSLCPGGHSGEGLAARKSSLAPNRSPLSPEIDAIAITVGPGLIGSLLVGVETAKTLSYLWNKPIIPVNHLQGHIYANWLSSPPYLIPDSEPTTHPHPQFPALALVVSGGHTELVLMKDHGKIEWLGGTRDDAAGECFDKCARLLGLGYPGGPAISAEAGKGEGRSGKGEVKLPRPMMKEDNFDFSFSGLKTAVLREVEKLDIAHNPKLIPTLAHEIQEAITDVLVAKTMRAAEKYKVKSILLAGGVAANSCLREKLHSPLLTSHFTHIPPPSLCTDNAAYIASCAFFNNHPKSWQEIRALPGLEITDKV
ncbi:MAG: tRNA (adenosine(37)-N6)-threonylcarbamoyltransferase complex transferase subunit TsaD [bacterium]|nr:tRNA (adenosine(37)-N6)-threonylcarbamoyltransferase complex transferase subunit TsaD [bacterium]